MIVVRIFGGLGNQLFQYALGKNLAHFNNVPLKLDISGFQTYKLHKYSLGNYNIKADISSQDDLIQLNGTVNKISFIYQERSFTFEPYILKIRNRAYLEGYWQSEKYFKYIRELLLEDFTVKEPLINQNLEIAEKIKNTNSVSLHVRRGDYVSDSNTNKFHGTCSLEYYKKCIEYIAERVQNPSFFIFSDDYEWVKENLLIEYETTFVHHNNADKNYEDLRLMSLCKHNITANSTFSWWGAWLNTNSDKIICSPIKWFNDPSINAKDLVPDNWIRI